MKNSFFLQNKINLSIIIHRINKLLEIICHNKSVWHSERERGKKWEYEMYSAVLDSWTNYWSVKALFKFEVKYKARAENCCRIYTNGLYVFLVCIALNLKIQFISVPCIKTPPLSLFVEVLQWKFNVAFACF